jgi:tripartite-type tricarboxylate transporter receptor subunit TctC
LSWRLARDGALKRATAAHSMTNRVTRDGVNFIHVAAKQIHAHVVICQCAAPGFALFPYLARRIAALSIRPQRASAFNNASRGGYSMSKLTRRTFMAAAGGVAATATLGNSAFAQAAYPSRPIQLICPWGAGGGTDAVARIIATLMEKDLGQPIAVVNRTGGNGVVGHSAIATAAPDGYTLGIITVELVMMHWMGLTQLVPTDYTPIGLVNEDPPVVIVKADGPYADLKALLAAIKANPGKLKGSGTSQGGIWHLALVGMLQSLKIPASAVPWVPSTGSAAALQDLVAGGIDVVCCSAAEGKSLVDAGKVKYVCVMASKRDATLPNVPTLKEAAGSEYITSTWRGIAGPKNLPAPILDKLSASLKKAYDSKEFKDFMANRNFGTSWADGKGYAEFMAKSDAAMGEAMKSAGLAK